MFVTLAEAAELEQVKYNTMVQRIKRKPEAFTLKTEKAEKGGKDVVYVAVESLSRQARAQHRERERLKEFAVTVPQEAEPQEQAQVPWYVDTDLDWYIENYKANYYKGMELGNIVREFLGYDGPDKTVFAESFSQERLGKGYRTLYRYVKTYQEAAAWAAKLEKETGASYDFLKVLSLCRKPKEAGTFPSITAEVKQVIKNIWFNEDFARNLGTREMLYEKLNAVAAVNGWEKLPSYQTVARYISHLMNGERMKNAHFLIEKGTREYKNRVMVKASRDTSSLKVMEMVMGDEHTFDCWVSYRQPNGKLTAIKPKLVAWIDVRSRAIMGDLICKDPNSDILKQSLLKMAYSEIGGIPQYLFIDNGKDYTAETMTGLPRKERSEKERREERKNWASFENETKGFYKSIGIEDSHRALPYQPWSKGQIERPFLTVCNKFTKWFKSYTGTLTGSQTDAKVEKDIQKMLKRGELLTMEEFYQRWQQWLNEKYMKYQHRGLKNQGETYITPLELFQNGERYFKAAPPKSYATMLMMKSENVRVYNVGIKRKGYEYRSQELCKYIGEHVNIKYDPEDMATLYVFDKDGKRICEAYSQELLQMAPKVHQKTLIDHLKMQKTQLKEDRKVLEEANRPFTEMNDQYIGFSDTVGGIELMVGNKKNTAKVVSMPEDRTYQAGFRKQENSQEPNDYMKQQAQKALEKLEAIGQ